MSDGTGTDASLAHTLEEIIANARRLVEIDAAAFLVVDWRTEEIRPAALWFASEELRRALLPLLQRRYDRERPGITESALESGKPLLFRRVESWEGAAALRARLERDFPPEQADVTWHWYRRASAISCPVATSEGRSLGVLAVSATPPLPELGADALRSVEVFADLAAVAIDRAQLLEAEARRSRQELVLNDAGRAIAESLDTRVVHRRIVERAAAVTGATKVLLAEYYPAVEQLEVVASSGFSEEVASRRYSLREGMIGLVAATRAPYRSRPEDRDRFLSSVVDRERIGSFMHVPIELGPRLFGVLTVAHGDETAFDEASFEQLLKFARLAAAAVANAADYQHELRVARALAQGFIPTEPGRLPGVELGVRYEPAERQPTGGDLYGAWPLTDGSVAVLIGDAIGKGLEVAGLAAMVRFFADARSLGAEDPAQVLRETNALIRTRVGAETFVTVFFAILRGPVLRYCNAGHAPPLVVPAEGDPRELEATGIPLGIENDPQLESREEALGSGDLLFAFTDGLPEARRRGEQFGERELGRAIAELRGLGHPQGLVDAVYQRALDWAGPLTDDAALLALRLAR
ncbi:MAG: SpoIIE family protein phosphatase [Thermoleophilaceae bacterium]